MSHKIQTLSLLHSPIIAEVKTHHQRKKQQNYYCTNNRYALAFLEIESHA